MYIKGSLYSHSYSLSQCCPVFVNGNKAAKTLNMFKLILMAIMVVAATCSPLPEPAPQPAPVPVPTIAGGLIPVTLSTGQTLLIPPNFLNTIALGLSGGIIPGAVVG